MKGIMLDYGSTNKEIKVPTKKFSSPKNKTKFQMLDHKFQSSARHMYPKFRNLKNSTWGCHHCGKYGLIMPYCYRLYRYPQPHDQPMINRKNFQARKEWNSKDTTTDFIANTSLRVSSR